MHTPQPTIYGFGRNVHLWHFPWPKRPWPKCPGRNVLGRSVRGRNVLHSYKTNCVQSIENISTWEVFSSIYVLKSCKSIACLKYIVPYFTLWMFDFSIPSRCQTVWIQIRPNILTGLIWVQTVCKGYQQTTKVDPRG